MDIDLVQSALLFTVLLISLVVHEAAHATVGLLGGDRTAYLGGQVTLNPIPHVRRSPIGMVVIPIILLLATKNSAIAGFASAPYDPAWASRHPQRAALMAAAGPLSNVALALIACAVLLGLVYGDGITYWELQRFAASWGGQTSREGAAYAVARIATTFLQLNIFLALLNLLPWPPLDGASVLEGFFPKLLRPFYDLVRSQSGLSIVGFIAVMYAVQSLFHPTYNFVWNRLLDLAKG